MRKLLLIASAALTLVSAPAFAGGITACVHARTQIGNGSSDSVNQNCQYNLNGQVQAGGGMSATARQSGPSNSSSQLQLGNGNYDGTSQHGRDNSAGAMQVGDGNRVRVHQW